jgi:hypothetical protein
MFCHKSHAKHGKLTFQRKYLHDYLHAFVNGMQGGLI